MHRRPSGCSSACPTTQAGWCLWGVRHRPGSWASPCGMQLLVDAAGEEAAIDHEDFAGHEAGSRGREEDAGAGKLRDAAEALHRRARQELPAAPGAVEQLRI